MSDRQFVLMPFKQKFRFSHHAHQAPQMDHTGLLTAGKEWMRHSFPSQWALFCYARLHKKTEVLVTKPWWPGFNDPALLEAARQRNG